MRIRCTFKREGPGPSEQIVSIKTRDGEEQLVLSTRKLNGHQVEVGEPLATEPGMFLVELPRETASGRWRVWVSEDEIAGQNLMAAE